MSNHLYELHCSINYPMHLTTLDRLLLGHYCYRFNPNLTPPRAFPGIEELSKITGMEMRSVLRSRSRLVKLGLLVQITRGRPNVTSEFRVPEELLNKLARMTEESPDSVPSAGEVTGVPHESELDDPPVPERSLVSHPRSIESYKSNQSNASDSRFNLIVCRIPNAIQTRISPGKNLDLLLDALEQAGKPPTAIRDYLGTFSWGRNSNPGGVLIKRLEGLLQGLNGDLGSKLPAWCGECDEQTRKSPVAKEIPNGNGAKTFDCPLCSKFWANLSRVNY